jgi:aquaporin rerated protein, other eukaryote
MLAKEKHKATFMAPIGIGLALFISELVGVYYTGGSLNPARSFGPAVVSASFESSHWIYWFGPVFGSLGAVALYKLVLVLHYEIGNPGQDEESEEAAAEVAEIVKARVEADEIV